jgi:ubiquinone biosynthesis protein
LEQDRLGLHVRLLADADDRRFVTRLVRDVLLTIVGAVTGVTATVLLTTSGGPQVTETVTLVHLIGYHLLVISAVVLLRVVATIARHPD